MSNVRALGSAAFGVSIHPNLPRAQRGEQPLADQRLLLAADIRLDNRQELSSAVGLEGQVATDLQLLFAAWTRWGVGTLNRIVGDYAIAAFDVDRRELILARDPSGQRPLFFTANKDGIRFASMPSGIFCGSQAVPDLGRLAQLLARGGAHDARSCFVGVQRVLPGQAVIFANGQHEPIHHWQPSLAPFEGRTVESLVEEYRALLDQAVAARVDRNDGALATHLSSGLDSSAVTATAARLRRSGDRIIAFTAAPAFGPTAPGPYNRPTDESPIAIQTAKSLDIEHVVVRDAQPLLDGLRDYSRFYQEPVRNVLNNGWWTQINRVARQMGANVLLTAEMGNATLNAGEIGLLSEWIGQGRWRQWWSEARAVMREKGASWRGVAVASFEPWTPAWLISTLERVYGARPSWTVRFFSSALADTSRNRPPRTQAAERRDGFMAIDFGPLRKGCLGQFGIDQRDPMADQRLAEFALRLPVEHMMHGGQFCPLARRALADRVPENVLNLPLRGYQGGDWPLKLKKGDVAAVIEEIAPCSAAQELLDFGRLHDLLAKWPALDVGANADLVLGRDLTAALAAGVFVADVQRYPDSLGR